MAYSKCRGGQLSLQEFPDFMPLLNALKSESPVLAQKSFKVTTQVHDKLVVLESLVRKWLDEETTAQEAEAILASHNETYNPEGGTMGDRTPSQLMCQSIA